MNPESEGGNLVSAVSGENRDRIREVFRLCLSRTPKEDEEEKLLSYFDSQLEKFQGEEFDPKPIVGEVSDASSEADLPTYAALTTVARALLNLVETITKE